MLGQGHRAPPWTELAVHQGQLHGGLPRSQGAFTGSRCTRGHGNGALPSQDSLHHSAGRHPALMTSAKRTRERGTRPAGDRPVPGDVVAGAAAPGRRESLAGSLLGSAAHLRVACPQHSCRWAEKYAQRTRVELAGRGYARVSAVCLHHGPYTAGQLLRGGRPLDAAWQAGGSPLAPHPPRSRTDLAWTPRGPRSMTGRRRSWPAAAIPLGGVRS